MLGAFGDPGHAFPLIALGCALRARGHEVTVQTWERWQPDIERVGLQFAPMSEYAVFPTRAQPRGLYAAAVAAARETAVLIEQRQPDAVVADILTIAPALAAERAGVPWATLIPHLHPVVAPGFPPFSLGARLPRGAAGRAMWRAVARFSGQGVELGRQELNAARRELGLAPLDHPHGGISRELCLVATFPQLEYPRSWAPSEHVVGPLAWEPPAGDLPPLGGDDRPLVLVAPSTSQDPAQRLVRAALAGLAELPVRVVAVARRLDHKDRVSAERSRRSWTGSPTPASCRALTWSSLTAATARWRAPSAAVCRWWCVRPPGICSRTRPVSTGPASARACHDGC